LAPYTSMDSNYFCLLFVESRHYILGDIMSIKFKCPDCGCERAECEEENAVAFSNITVIREDGDLDFEAPSIQDSDVARFGCLECNFSAQDSDGNNIIDNAEFAEWCKENCPQD